MPLELTRELRVPANKRVGAVAVSPDSWTELLNPDGWLSDEAIMAGISSLFHRYPTRAGRLFVLSSYELTRWREGMSAPELHRLVAAVAPWKREQVIIPINQGNAHWTVAVVWPQQGLIEMFDSFASKATMRAQAHVSRARADRY